MGDDSRIPPLSRRVPGATNWPTPPVRATPPELPEHVIERLRARPNRASEAATALAEAERPDQSAPPPPRTGTAPGLPRRPVRVLWRATSDSALLPEVDAADTTERIPVVAATADIRTETVAPTRADTQPDNTAAQVQTATALAPPATLPRRVPGSHGPQPSPGRSRGVTALPRTTRRRPRPLDPPPLDPPPLDPLPPKPGPPGPRVPDPLPPSRLPPSRLPPGRLPPADVPPAAVPSVPDAESRTEPIPVVAAAVHGGHMGPALDGAAVELDTPAASVSAAAIPADLDRRAKEPTRRVQRWRWLRTWLAGVSAAPQVPAHTMLRPLFAECDTLEELLACVRAQADVHSVHARRVRMIALGVALVVIVVILAIVLLV
jgi:hypothetical protein